MSTKLLVACGSIVAASGVVFITVLLALLCGAVTGYVCGLVFPGTLAKLAAVLGLAGTPSWQLGAMLGFVGGFFRSHLKESK